MSGDHSLVSFEESRKNREEPSRKEIAKTVSRLYANQTNGVTLPPALDVSIIAHNS